MIILKILLWILLIILGLIVLICIVPAIVEVSFVEGKFSYKVKLWLLNVMDSEGGGLLGWWKKRKEKKKEEAAQDNENDEQTAENEGSDDEQPDSDDENTDDDVIEEPEIDETDPSEEQETENSQPETAKPETENDTDSADEEEELVAPEINEDDIADEDEESDKNEKPKKTLGEKVDFVLDLWRAADRPLLRIFKGVKLSELYIDFIIANEDAYKCAVNYGRISGIFYNLLAWLSALFTVKIKTIDVKPGFAMKKSRWDAAVKVSFQLGTLVIAGIWFLVIYIFKYFIPNKLRRRKFRKKSAARQK